MSERQDVIRFGEPTFRVVGHDDAGAAGRGEQGVHQRGGLGVEVRARLVEQEQLGLVQERAADGHALRHAGREVAKQLGAVAAHADAVEKLGDARPGAAVDVEPVQAGVEAQVLRDREVAVEQRLVAEVAEPPANAPRLARQLAAEDPGASAARAQERREDAQQRRLAGPVGAEDGEGLAGGEG